MCIYLHKSRKSNMRAGKATLISGYIASQLVINNWNNLSNHVVSSSNTNTFQNRLDSYWKYHPARYDWEASDYFHPFFFFFIINCEIRSHSGSGKRGGICLLPEFTIRYHKVRYDRPGTNPCWSSENKLFAIMCSRTVSLIKASMHFATRDVRLAGL